MHRCYATRHYITLHYNMLTKKKTDQIFTRFLKAAVLLGEEKGFIYYNEAVFVILFSYITFDLICFSYFFD